MIFLNLFLAILLENFEIDEEEEFDSYMQSIRQKITNVTDFIKKCFEVLINLC